MADKVCIPPNLRGIIEGVLFDIEMHPVTLKEIVTRFKEIPDCKSSSPRGGTAKKKRAPSAYNKFMGECLRSDEIKKKFKVQTRRMSECATRWKKEKSK